jgi:hypothetical protein
LGLPDGKRSVPNGTSANFPSVRAGGFFVREMFEMFLQSSQEECAALRLSCRRQLNTLMLTATG